MSSLIETPFVVPPGKALGCKLRDDYPGQYCGFLPKAYVIPRDEWSEWIGKVDLRPRVFDIYDQDGVGSCAAEAANQANMIRRATQGLEQVLFSPWFTYHTTSGGRDQGSSLIGNLRHIRDVGSCPMSLWPRSKGWRAKPPQECYDAAAEYRIDEFWEVGSTLEVGSALLRGFPVSFGWNGHSCCLVNLVSESMATYANSWDESWGDNGFGTIRLSSINFGYGAYAWRA